MNPGNINFPMPAEFEDMVLYNSGQVDPLRILALGDLEQVHRLRFENIWFGDGTFNVVPSMYYPLYTIHCKVGNSDPPCVYFLLPDKTEQTYSRMVQILANLLPDANPEKILLDFEVAAHNAFRAVYRNTSISGCFFHLGQRIQRKVSDVGLKRRFESDEEFSMMVRSLSALAFVPPNQVGNVFNQLSEAFPGEDDQDFDQITELLLYFETTYIRNRGRLGQVRPARYPAVVWNHTHQALDCLPKTTNCVEGFHNALMSMFLCKHPTVWVLFKGLRRDVAVARYILQHVQNNANRLNIYRNIEVRLQGAVRAYAGEDDVLRYLRSIAHMQVP